MKIGIVNDMFMAAEALRRAVMTGTNHDVLWIAENGRVAVERCAQQKPDLVLMDLVMPEMDGVEATRRIMAATPCAIVIVTASVDGLADQVFAAMGAGALDAVNTPLLGLNGDAQGRTELLAKIKTIDMLIQPPKRSGFCPVPAPVLSKMGSGYQLVAIGASSGGPSALAKILGQLPAGYPVPIVVIQHVDQQFAAEFAHWLKSQTELAVELVNNESALAPGRVYLSARNEHLVLNACGKLSYEMEPCDYPHIPSIDVFYDSVIQNLRGRAIAVLLTGMGRDGAEAMLRMRRQGHLTIAQDEATSAVYGMPRAAADIGAANFVLPLLHIATVLKQKVRSTGSMELQS